MFLFLIYFFIFIFFLKKKKTNYDVKIENTSSIINLKIYRLNFAPVPMNGIKLDRHFVMLSVIRRKSNCTYILISERHFYVCMYVRRNQHHYIKSSMTNDPGALLLSSIRDYEKRIIMERGQRK